jgi:protein-export membrane protein SecD
LGPRVGRRLILILILVLAAVQFAFRPVAFVGRRPVLQPPQIHMNLGLDLKGGSMLVLEGEDTPTLKATPEAMDAAMRVIERRIDELGVAEPTIQRQGSNRIIVELPGISDPQRAIALIGKTALLEFVDTGTQQLPEDAKWSADGTMVTLPARVITPGPSGQAPAGQVLPIVKKVVLAGADLDTAQASFNQQTTEPIVNFTFKGKAARQFEEYTGRNIGKYLTIVLDNVVISSPVIRDRIPGGSGQISGGFQSIEEARDLAVLLRGGSLPIPVQVVENRTVGPQLGRDSIDTSLRAAQIAVVTVGLFMLLFYGLPGLLADLALVLYLLVVLAVLTGLGATLTLPGMAGIVLSLGMAVDANVIIFEKLKEEMRAGKSLRVAVGTGWHRAIATIVDSNVTTLIAAMVLFLLGSGPIRGFAVTLSVGVLVSMFSAIVVTRALVDTAAAVGLGPALMRLAGRFGR